MDTNTKAAAQRYNRGPYKRHPVAFKRAVVEASLAPGASVSRVAREHDINANQVFLWRRLYRDGLLNAGQIVGVVVHVVSVPRLAGSAMAAPAVGDHPVALRSEEQHLRFPAVGGERWR